MPLLTLPNEILATILDYTIHDSGVQQSIEFRFVCSKFFTLIEDRIFRLPTSMLRGVTLSKPMISRLILSKLKQQNAQEFIICRAIHDTVNYLISVASTNQVPTVRYDKALAKAAAQSMFCWECLDQLKVDNENPPIGNPMDNALIAAIAAHQPLVVDELLKRGANPVAKTRFFGEPLSVAATSTNEDILKSLIASHAWEYATSFTHLRFQHAIETAAENGQDEALSLLLQPEHCSYQGRWAYDRAVIMAIRSSQESSAILLLRRRPQTPDPSQPDHMHALLFREPRFWLDVVRTAAVNNCMLVLEEAISKALSVLDEVDFAKPLEDASRENHDGPTRLILSKLSDKKPHIYSGYLFWTARSGNTALLDSTLEFLRRDSQAIIMALAGAVSGKQVALVHHLLQTSGVEKASDLASVRFSDAMHLLFPNCLAAQELVPDLPSTNILMEITSSKDPADTFRIIKAIRAAHTKSDSDAISLLLHGAIQHNRPDILLYIYETCESHVRDHKTIFPTILQILLDFGAGINDRLRFGSHRMQPFFHDEIHSRWLLSIGANPTSTRDDRRDSPDNPIDVAISTSSVPFIKTLLEMPGGIEKWGLLVAAMEREADSLELIEILLGTGYPINRPLFWVDESVAILFDGNENPLYRAIISSKPELVAYLLQQGASTSILRTRRGISCRAYQLEDYYEIVRLLRQYGA